MSRREYHRMYYWRNVHKRRKQRRESKQRKKWQAEYIEVAADGELVRNMMGVWR